MDTDVQTKKMDDSIVKQFAYVKLSLIDTNQYQVGLTSICRKFLQQTNLLSTTQAASSFEAEPQRTFLFDYMLNPMVGYLVNDTKIEVTCGLFSYLRFVKNPVTKIPVLLFNEKPSDSIQQQLIIAEITHILLDRLPISGVENLHTVLCSLFETDTHGIFASSDWKKLYPGIKNKAQFCKWLGISSKTFRDKREVHDA